MQVYISKKTPSCGIYCHSSNWSFLCILGETLPLLNHHHVGRIPKPPGGWMVWRRPRHIIADATIAPLALIIPSWPKTETELRVDPHKVFLSKQLHQLPCHSWDMNPATKLLLFSGSCIPSPEPIEGNIRADIESAIPVPGSSKRCWMDDKGCTYSSYTIPWDWNSTLWKKPNYMI